MEKSLRATISLEQARRIALAAGAGFAPPQGRGAQGVGEIVDRIGYVQVDTISVVERAHHHILYSRYPRYRQDDLAAAPVFEYWAHAAAYLSWRDFPHTLPRKERIRAQGHDWFRAEQAEAAKVLERIRAEGPLLARDFEAAGKTEGWWDWKPAKRALEYLFQAGELMVAARRGFQKVFDLTERVLPPGTATRTPTGDEHARWYAERALDAWGIVARDEIAYQRREHAELIDGALAELEEEGRVVRVGVEGIAGVPYWTRPVELERCGGAADAAADDSAGAAGSGDGTAAGSRSLRILSPFDPFIIHRKRVQRLFGLDYTVECYVPAHKRRFGYFALPLLWGDSFAGLIDLKADRKQGVLKVNALRYDGPPRRRPAFDKALSRALDKFAAYNGVGR